MLSRGKFLGNERAELDLRFRGRPRVNPSSPGATSPLLQQPTLALTFLATKSCGLKSYRVEALNSRV